MTEVPLANGKGVALVDDADVHLIADYSWARISPHGHTSYAYAWVYNPRRRLSMHQLLIPGAERVDHIDGDGLNNQRYNLRACSHSQNMMNTRPYNGKRFKGVTQVKSSGNWRAYIQPKGMKQINLGFYSTEEEAARAYDVAAVEFFGEFARLNLPLANTEVDLPVAA